jgi:hypothetical protein
MSRLFIVYAHPDDGKRFVVRADEKPTVFLELQALNRLVALLQQWHSCAAVMG